MLLRLMVLEKNLMIIDLFFSFLSKLYPDFVIGVDLISEEDTGHPLLDLADQLNNLPKGAKLFAHAGETSKLCQN